MRIGLENENERKKNAQTVKDIQHLNINESLNEKLRKINL